MRTWPKSHACFLNPNNEPTHACALFCRNIAAGLAAVVDQHRGAAPLLRRQPPRHPRHAAAGRRRRQRDALDR